MFDTGMLILITLADSGLMSNLPGRVKVTSVPNNLAAAQGEKSEIENCSAVGLKIQELVFSLAIYEKQKCLRW